MRIDDDRTLRTFKTCCLPTRASSYRSRSKSCPFSSDTEPLPLARRTSSSNDWRSICFSIATNAQRSLRRPIDGVAGVVCGRSDVRLSSSKPANWCVGRVVIQDLCNASRSCYLFLPQVTRAMCAGKEARRWRSALRICAQRDKL